MSTLLEEDVAAGGFYYCQLTVSHCIYTLLEASVLCIHLSSTLCSALIDKILSFVYIASYRHHHLLPILWTEDKGRLVLIWISWLLVVSINILD